MGIDNADPIMSEEISDEGSDNGDKTEEETDQDEEVSLSEEARKRQIVGHLDKASRVEAAKEEDQESVETESRETSRATTPFPVPARKAIIGKKTESLPMAPIKRFVKAKCPGLNMLAQDAMPLIQKSTVRRTRTGCEKY